MFMKSFTSSNHDSVIEVNLDSLSVASIYYCSSSLNIDMALKVLGAIAKLTNEHFGNRYETYGRRRP